MTRQKLPTVVSGPTPFESQIGRPDEPFTGERVIEVGIALRDGIELAADVYLPPADALPAPVVVTITPYGKSSPGQLDGEALFFRANGYVVVVVDCRGRGKSEGEWIPAVHDADDAHDVVEWAADASWSAGKVGMTGHSYAGWVAWAAASRLPRGLTCMISSSAIGAWQQEIPYNNGVLQLNCAWWLYGVRKRIQESSPAQSDIDWESVLRTLPVRDIREKLGIPPTLWDAVMEEDRLVGAWEQVRFEQSVYDAIRVPCLHVTGWFDMEDLVGAFHHYERMIRGGVDGRPQNLIVGPWNHPMVRWPHSDHAEAEYGPEAAVDMNAVHLAWLDRWLKHDGVPAEPAAEQPPVWVWETGTDHWRAEQAWPMASDTSTLYLTAPEGLHRARGALSSRFENGGDDRTFVYDPDDPVMTGPRVYRYGMEDIPLDQTEVELRDDVLVYTSEVLESDVTLSGNGIVFLQAASDGDDTEWHVKLTDVDRHGRSIKVSQGCLRASHRDSLTEPTAIVPGEFYDYRIPLWPAQHVFRRGHRIRVSVTSSDFPWNARNLNRFGALTAQATPRIAANTIRHRGRSRVELPIEVGEHDDERVTESASEREDDRSTTATVSREEPR